MKRTWPIVAVRNVAESSAWYTRLLNATNNHPRATVFEAAIEATIKEGHMVGSGEETAAICRRMTKRPQPY